MAILKCRICVSNGNENRMIYSDENEFQHLFSFNEHPSTVMNYSGLKDSQENEVYESDILKVDGNLYIAFWEYRHARFVLEHVRSKKIHTNFRELVRKGKVIGNLAEHHYLVQ